MLSTTVLGDDNCHASLSTMPPEVATNIFCQLPSFSDVFALSAVCLRLRHLWLENVNSIYNQIAPRSIPCESAARRFLVDDDGPGLEFPMSAKDVIRVVQNAGVIENTVLQFEREVVRWVKSELYSNVRIVRRVELTFMCNSGCLWPSRDREILWAGRAKASSDPHSHRTDTFHSFLLLRLDSNES